MKRNMIAAAAAAVIAVALAPSAQAANIIDEWASVTAPAAPALKPVTVDPKTTALLMLDFVNPNCSRLPRCLASLPLVKKMLVEARAKGVAIVYSTGRGGKVADILPEVTPVSGEPTVTTGVDKFFGTDLDKILKDKGIQTVIVVGTVAHGAVLYTASAAAIRGMTVVVPVDGMSAAAPYMEQYTAWHLPNGPGFGSKVTLTKTDMIKF